MNVSQEADVNDVDGVLAEATAPAGQRAARMRALARSLLAEAERAATQTFRIGDFTCKVGGTAGNHEAAMRAFLPWPPDEDRRAVAWSIGSVVSSDACSRCREYASSCPPDELLDTFAGETILRRYRLGDEIDLLINQTADDHAFIRAGTSVAVIAPSPDPRFATYAVRAFREAFHRDREESGALMMHAGACAWAGNGVMIVGDKGAGKTTLLLAACLAGEADYIANDRTMIAGSAAAAAWTVSGFPLALRVHPGTFSALPRLTDLARRARELERPQHEAFSRPGSDIAELAASADMSTKLELTPREMTTRLGIPVVERASLLMMVFPRIRPDEGRVTSSLMTADQSYEELRAQCMTPHEEKWITPWLVPRSRSCGAMESHRDSVLETISEHIPAIRLQYGFAAGSAAQAGRLLARMMTNAQDLPLASAPQLR